MKTSTIIGTILIILALTCGTSYIVGELKGNSAPSWLTNDVDELKANANTHYQNTMKNHVPSVAEVEKDVQIIVDMHENGESVIKIKTNAYEYKKAGSVIEVKTNAYEYKKAGSVVKIETANYEYKKAGSVVKMEYK